MAELVDAKYGENKVYEEQQRVMPAVEAQALPDTPAPTDMAPESPGGMPFEPPPSLGMFAGPSERPNEPVTSGSPFGPGPNSLALGPNGPLRPQQLSQTLASYGAMDDTGIVAELAQYFDGMNI